MAVQYTNRRGQTFYLHQGAPCAGRPNYYFSLSAEGNPVDAVPDGYEVYEHPRGQVFLRRVRAQAVRPDEIATVEREIRRHARLRHSRIDVRGRIITVYIPNVEAERSLAELLQEVAGERRIDIPAIVARGRQLSPDFRLKLIDEERRVFQAQRYCYLGSIDDWIHIGSPGGLRDLVRTYVQHLGKDS
ncbi:MAG: hypothetical protein QME94_18855, partial [Anaerolineae bacterium]|nr:hypothetical protein [Anaerolineae bacterium]